MDNHINFKGGFLIKKPSVRMWNDIKTVLPKHKCIVENINKNGDNFVSVKPLYDRDLAKFILSKRNLEFKYYPDINLKNRIDAYHPEEALATVEAQTHVIDNRKELTDYIRANYSMYTPPIYHWKPNDQIEQTLKALKLDKNECSIEIKDNVTSIFDKNNKKIAIASPNGPRGINFVYVFSKNAKDVSPRNKNTEPERLAVDSSGKIIWKYTILEATNFKNYFNRNIRIDKSRKRPKAE